MPRITLNKILTEGEVSTQLTNALLIVIPIDFYEFSEGNTTSV